MSLTLYWNLASQPARSVKCLIDIAKLDVNYVTLDVIKNETRSKEYLSLNPLGKIPFLVDGQLKISESNAILVYLCEKYPQTLGKYYGTTPRERAKVNQHLSWYQNFYRPALFKIIFLKIYQGIRQGKPVMAKYVQAAEKEMFQTLGEFQKLLKAGGTNFAAGDRVTIADFQYFFELTNLVIYEKTFDQYRLVTEWYNRVAQIPEVKAITEEWLKLTPFLTQALRSVPLQPDSKL